MADDAALLSDIVKDENQQFSDDLLKEIRDNYDAAIEGDRKNREEAEVDLQFLAGKQWPEEVRLERESDNRPCITENNLPQFVRQIVGDMRAMRPAIKIIPDGNGATKEVAEIQTGIIRDIEAKAASGRPYLTAGASAARCGIGHWRVLHDYEDDKTFDQCIKLESIENPFAVVWDPLSGSKTRGDANYCFVTDLMPEEVFKLAYPDAHVTSFDVSEQWSSHWYDKAHNSVRVAEYWRKKPVQKRLLRLVDGQAVFEEQLPPEALSMVVDQRVVDTFVVEVIKTNGYEILEPPREWATKHIPIVAVVGEEFEVGEGRVRHSAIRFARDPQQLYNYWLSTQTEHLALQPKAPFIATAKQVAKFKQDWKEANEKNRPVLLYEVDGQAPPPQRQSPPASSGAMSEQLMRAANAMKSTTGIYDAGLGARSNEQSGKAILARQRESDVGTSEFLDNLAASIAYTGEIIIELIPHIYDTERQIRVLSEDGSETFEEVNKRLQTPEGEKLINALFIGKYGVNVTTGPSYTTRRQEAADSMMDFMRVNPQAGQIVMDLVAKNMDWPGADQFAERFQKMLPPQIQPDTDDPEELQKRQQALQQAAQAAQIQRRGIVAEIAEKEGKAAKTMADAQKTAAETANVASDTRLTDVETAQKQLELMLQSGALQGLVQQMVAQQIAAMTEEAARGVQAVNGAI